MKLSETQNRALAQIAETGSFAGISQPTIRVLIRSKLIQFNDRMGRYVVANDLTHEDRQKIDD